MRRSVVAVLAVSAGIAAVSPLDAAEIELRSAIDTVTVYPDGATVTRIIRVDVPQGDNVLLARDFPPTLDVSSLRVEGAAEGRLTIGAIDARPPRAERPPVSPELEKKIEALRDERGALEDQIGAATARKKFAQRFAEVAPVGLGEKGEARPLAEWRAAFAAVAEEIAVADGAIREARHKQREIDRELARLEAERNANPPRKMEVRIDLASTAATAAVLRVSYSVRGARWLPRYDARLDTGGKDRKPALELVRRAEILQNTGEDWSDVALSVSTVRTHKGGSAPDLQPLVVRYPEPPRPMAAMRGDQLARSVAPARAAKERFAAGLPEPPAPAFAPAQESEAMAETGGFQAVFRIPGRVSVATNEGSKSFRIGTAKIAPELTVRATPALDETGYLEASFKHVEEAPLLPGRVAIYRDGVFVGQGHVALTPKEEAVRLGFGADEKVKISRATVRRSEGSSGIITSTKTDEREYKITMRNGHDQPIKITIEDQIPVSEIEAVKVEMLPSTTPPTATDVKDRRGVMAWTMEVAPAETKEIRLGWRVRWPADKSISYGGHLP